MSQAGIVVKQVSTGGAISSSSGEKKRKKKYWCWESWGRKEKRLSSAKFHQKGFFPIWPTDLQHNPAQLDRGVEGEEEKGQKKNKSHKKTQASCTSQQTVFKLVQKTENNSIKISQMTPSSILNGTLLISNKITIDWAEQLERFRLVLRDHFCRGVFFFRFRLKKQQHLQKDVDVKWARGWEKHQMKHEKEQTRQCVKYHRSLIWVLFLCLLNQNSNTLTWTRWMCSHPPSVCVFTSHHFNRQMAEEQKLQTDSEGNTSPR